MVKEVEGTIFEQNVKAMVNLVSLSGTMKEGLPAEFKAKYKIMFNQYERDCQKKYITPDDVRMHKVRGTPGKVINLAVMDKEGEDFSNDYFKRGLTSLVKMLEERSVESIAIPFVDGCMEDIGNAFKESSVEVIVVKA